MSSDLKGLLKILLTVVLIFFILSATISIISLTVYPWSLAAAAIITHGLISK